MIPRRVVIILLVLLCIAMPAVAVSPISHDTFIVFQATPPAFQSPPGMVARQPAGVASRSGLAGYYEITGGTVFDGSPLFRGLNGLGPDVITAVPGMLAIDPGANWSNYVSAAAAGVPYTMKNVIMRKVAPQVHQCIETFRSGTKAVQHGTPNIRLWWPVLYEVPGTVWTLTITYGTPMWADPANPTVKSSVHTDIWTWRVEADLDSMLYLVELFHELPFGLDEVPLISDEDLYLQLVSDLSMVEFLWSQGDPAGAGDAMVSFEMEVADACISISPSIPRPSGGDTGIANDTDNPACCKLLIDAEYVGTKLGIYQQSK